MTTNNRPTPETDSFVPLRVHHPSLPSWDDYVLVSFAHKLERERDEARDLARELQNSLARVVSWWDKIDRGADEMEDSEVNIIATEARAALTKAKEVLP